MLTGPESETPIEDLVRLLLALALLLAFVGLGPVRLAGWLLHHYLLSVVYVTIHLALNRHLFLELLR